MRLLRNTYTSPWSYGQALGLRSGTEPSSVYPFVKEAILSLGPRPSFGAQCLPRLCVPGCLAARRDAAEDVNIGKSRERFGAYQGPTVVAVHPQVFWANHTKHKNCTSLASGGGSGAEVAQSKRCKCVGPKAPHMFYILIAQTRPPDSFWTHDDRIMLPFLP